eukprot:1157938-Pelagomonas_calceolata.AAC.1
MGGMHMGAEDMHFSAGKAVLQGAQDLFFRPVLISWACMRSRHAFQCRQGGHYGEWGYIAVADGLMGSLGEQANALHAGRRHASTAIQGQPRTMRMKPAMHMRHRTRPAAIMRMRPATHPSKHLISSSPILYLIHLHFPA